MKNVIICSTILLLFLSTTGCSIFKKREHKNALKSPCVDNSGPCQHIPINNWWLPENKQIKYNV